MVDHEECTICGADVPSAMWGIHQEEHALTEEPLDFVNLDRAIPVWLSCILVGTYAGIIYTLLS